MNRRGGVSFGCLIWGAVILFAAVTAWKLIDFFILGPAKVKRVMNQVYSECDDNLNPNLVQAQYLREWAELRDSPDGIPEMRAPNTATFSGDTFVVEFSDSISIPGFSPYRHTFRLSRLVR